MYEMVNVEFDKSVLVNRGKKKEDPSNPSDKGKIKAMTRKIREEKEKKRLADLEQVEKKKKEELDKEVKEFLEQFENKNEDGQVVKDWWGGEWLQDMANDLNAKCRFTSASRAFTPEKLEHLKYLFNSLASKSQSNDQFVSSPVFEEYFGLSGALGEMMFDMVTQHRKDGKLTYEDLVIAKATYEKGTDDDIAETIYQTLDVNGNGSLTRGDIEAILVVIFKTVFSTESSDVESSDYNEMVDALLNAATYSKSDDGSGKGMSSEDFRKWCSLVPAIRKFFGSLLTPLSAARRRYQVPQLTYEDSVNSDRLLLKKEYAWHIGGPLPHDELVEWKLLYHSSLHDQNLNTFLRHTSNTGTSASVLIIKDKEGYVYGGYASQPWERCSDFYGDMKSFLFQLNPNVSIFRPTGANKNIQWCASNFTGDKFPNGIGFGGKMNVYGLFLSARFDRGQTFSCTTFGSPSLSKRTKIQPDVIECWGIVKASNEGEGEEAIGGFGGGGVQQAGEGVA